MKWRVSGWLLELALELQLGLRLRAGLALRRRDRAIERELALGVLVGEAPVGDLEPPDQRCLVAFLGRYRLGDAGRHRAFAEAPVQLLLVAHLDGDLGLAQHEVGQDQVALEQRPQPDVEIDPLDLQHVIGLAPIGVGHLDAVQVNVRGRAPVDRNLGDMRLAAGVGARAAFDPAAEVVGGHEEIARTNPEGDQAHENAGRPRQNPGGAPHWLILLPAHRRF